MGFWCFVITKLEVSSDYGYIGIPIVQLVGFSNQISGPSSDVRDDPVEVFCVFLRHRREYGRNPGAAGTVSGVTHRSLWWQLVTGFAGRCRWKDTLVSQVEREGIPPRLLRLPLPPLRV